MVTGEKPRKLGVGTMVRFSYRSVFGRLELIQELGWIVMLALLAASIVPDLVMPGRHAGQQFRLDVLDFAQAAIALLALSAFAVRWHQSILVGDPRRQPAALFFQGWMRFLIYGCAVYAVLGAIVAVAALALSSRTASEPVQAAVLLAAAAAWCAAPWCFRPRPPASRSASARPGASCAAMSGASSPRRSWSRCP